MEDPELRELLDFLIDKAVESGQWFHVDYNGIHYTIKDKGNHEGVEIKVKS